MIEILIVEDEHIIGQYIKRILVEFGYKVIGQAYNAEQAIKMLEESTPDLVLLDINLGKGEDGIEIAQRIDRQFSLPYIFLTSYTDKGTVERLKDVQPGAYLSKPFKKEDLYSAVELSISNFARTHFPEKNVDTDLDAEAPKDLQAVIDKSIFVKINRKLVKILFSDIMYVKSDRVYIEIHCKEKGKLVVRDALSSFETKLPASFFRIHRSYLINYAHIDSIGNSDIWINETEIPIGKPYYDNFIQYLRR